MSKDMGTGPRLSEDVDGAGNGTMSPAYDIREEPQPEPTRFRYVLYVLGVVMVFIGLKGIIHNTKNYENPVYFGKLFIGGALAHDLIIAPVVIAVLFVLGRLVPIAYRAPIQLGLFASAVLAFVAYPGVREFSYAKDNTSADPLNYAHGLLIALAFVWAVAVAALVRRFVIRRRSRA